MRLQIIARAAGGASYGLRMKAPVGGMGVFGGAFVVEQPVVHGRVLPVVRQAKHDGVTRTAVGAIDVGIPVMPVSRIEKLFQAVIANREVRRNTNRGMIAPLARPDSEVAQADKLRRLDIDFRDAGGGGRLGFQVANKSFQACFGSFEVDLDSLFRVEYPAIQSVDTREAIHERTEAYALHYPSHSDGTGAGHGYELELVDSCLIISVVSFRMSVLSYSSTMQP